MFARGIVMKTEDREQTAYLGGGCFWCLEAIFQRIEGVLFVEPGYSGGATDNPSYEEVCTGGTGHAEVLRIDFDPGIISYRELLEVFFQAHDPTTPNRQGADVGPQYRSIILYADSGQKGTAEEVLDDLRGKHPHGAEPVTELQAFERFYRAEAYHRDYYNSHLFAGYCRSVIHPKLKKMGLASP